MSLTPLRRAEATQLLRSGREGQLVEGKNEDRHENRREKFIPVTRRSLVRRLAEEEGLLNWEEKRLLENFAAALDARFSQRFQGILEETKVRRWEGGR